MIKSLSQGKSDFFDLLRWVSALIVVVGHSEMYGRMISGEHYSNTSSYYSYLASHAHSAVIVFFVLSGYLVAYSVNNKLKSVNFTFQEYFLDRWSRIYSVLIGAILFTLLIDFAGQFLSQDYHNVSYVPQDRGVMRFLVNLFGIQGIQGYRVQLGTNPALWSIGYEFTFYILFGLVVFKRQLFKNNLVVALVVTLILLVIGLKMAGYFLIWLVGVLAFYLNKRIKTCLPSVILALLSLGLILLNHFMSYKNIAGLDEYYIDFILALFLGALFSFEFGWKGWEGARVNKFMAEFSYSLYAFHMPIIFFYYAVLVKGFGFTSNQWKSGLLLTMTCLVMARGFFYITEAQRWKYRILGTMMINKLQTGAKRITGRPFNP